MDPAGEGEKAARINQGDHLNFLRCFLCNRSYTDPKLLPCLHSFCLACLQKSYSDQASLDAEYSTSNEPNGNVGEDSPNTEESLVCPMCRTHAPLPKQGIDGFKDNLLVIEMIRRWEEKLCENEPKSNRSSPSKSPRREGGSDGKSGSEEGCTCLPFWKRISNGKCTSDVMRMRRGVEGGTSADNDESDMSQSDGLDHQFFCVTCELIVCHFCKDKSHSEHHIVDSKAATSERREYLTHLLTDLSSKNNECETSLLQVQNTSEHIVASADVIVRQIEERSQSLIHAIEHQKDALIEELAIMIKHNKHKLSASKSYLLTENEKLKAATKFTKELVEHGSGSDLMYLTNDVSDRLHELLTERLSHYKNVANVRLEVPQIGYDDNHLHKVFGSLKQSEVKCGSAELIQSFDLDLKWPTGMAATPNREFIVTGKMGAFEEKGKVMFFTRSGALKTVYDLDERCIPYDTTVTTHGHVLVADNGGNIHKFDSSGEKLDTMMGMFKGVGRLATIHGGDGQFIITSSDEQKVKIYTYDGQLYMSIPRDGSEVRLDHPHYVATNKLNDIIVSDFKLHTVFVFDSAGGLKFKYSGNGVDAGELKCPSAVCCDNFNNVLVADFMNDRVHMLSPNGHFLGYLLTKDNSITCPNFLSTDGDGRLYVGQYGGQIQVFQYMGYLKFV